MVQAEGCREDVVQDEDSRGGLVFMQVLKLSFSGSISCAALSARPDERDRISTSASGRPGEEGDLYDHDIKLPFLVT